MTFSRFIDHIIVLARRLLLAYCLLILSRGVFFLFNLNAFRPIEVGELLRVVFFGLRFDFVVLYYLNIVFIFLHLFPFGFTEKRTTQLVLKILFVAVNGTMLLANLVDTGYFQYTDKRSGWELLEMLFQSPDTTSLLPHYIRDFWYLALILFLFIGILIWRYPKFRQYNYFKTYKLVPSVLISVFASILLIGLGLVGARGLNAKPIRMITANKYSIPKYAPVLLNTPFVMVNTMNQYSHKVTNFFPVDSIADMYSPVRRGRGGTMKKKNVIIIILESFGKEYFAVPSVDGKSFTPFLDSIMDLSLNCTQAYANAIRSMDALPPIIGGFPTMMSTPYVNSIYSVNNTRGLPRIFNEEGYNTSFFHGGANGTMSLDMFCEAVGIKDYHGRTEYDNDDHYDGGWGIYDEEFLQYMASEIDSYDGPFFSVFFSLSSHEPYPIPDRYSGKFFPDDKPVWRSVAYTDYSIKQFFETISEMDWYDETLFVFCPDHTSKAQIPYYNTSLGRLSIPIFYFAPGDPELQAEHHQITQQLDIMPTILDYLEYPDSYIAFGQSVFSEKYNWSVCFKDINYQVTDSAYTMIFDGEKAVSLYHYPTDSFLKRDIAETQPEILKALERNTQAYLQNYGLRIIQNKLADTLQLSQ